MQTTIRDSYQAEAQHMAVTGLRAGADDYIPKDIFAPEHLIDTLQEPGILED